LHAQIFGLTPPCNGRSSDFSAADAVRRLSRLLIKLPQLVFAPHNRRAKGQDMARQTVRYYRKIGIFIQFFNSAVFAAFALYMTYASIFLIPAKLAMPAEPPPAVSLSVFSRWTDVHKREEVNVIGKLESDQGLTLTRGDETRQMFVLFGPDGGPDDKVVRGLILLEKEDIEAFGAQFADMKAKAGTADGALMLNGFMLVLPDFDREAEANLKERGLTLSDQYIYIKPLLNGRGDPSDTPLWAKAVFPVLLWVVALAHLLVVRFRIRHNARVRTAAANGQIEALIPQLKKRDTILGVLALLVLIAVFVADAYLKKG
jgi:hypothetical protein